jgi:hypothetical protein
LRALNSAPPVPPTHPSTHPRTQPVQRLIFTAILGPITAPVQRAYHMQDAWVAANRGAGSRLPQVGTGRELARGTTNAAISHLLHNGRIGAELAAGVHGKASRRHVHHLAACNPHHPKIHKARNATQ